MCSTPTERPAIATGTHTPKHAPPGRSRNFGHASISSLSGNTIVRDPWAATHWCGSATGHPGPSPSGLATSIRSRCEWLLSARSSSVARRAPSGAACARGRRARRPRSRPSRARCRVASRTRGARLLLPSCARGRSSPPTGRARHGPRASRARRRTAGAARSRPGRDERALPAPELREQRAGDDGREQHDDAQPRARADHGVLDARGALVPRRRRGPRPRSRSPPSRAGPLPFRTYPPIGTRTGRVKEGQDLESVALRRRSGCRKRGLTQEARAHTGSRCAGIGRWSSMLGSGGYSAPTTGCMPASPSSSTFTAVRASSRARVAPGHTWGPVPNPR